VNKPYVISKGQFFATSADGGNEYHNHSLTRHPEPELIGMDLSTGDSREGWVAFDVPEGEKQPLLAFQRYYEENVYGVWGLVWFKLF
jgi:hypothetical protein